MGEAPKERPILFSAPMVRAILEGRKTQTRRVVKPGGRMSLFARDDDGSPMWSDSYILDPGNADWLMRDNRYGQPGDRLWVRETFSYDRLDVDHDGFMPAWYWADGNPTDGDWSRPKPSIHMPRAYSRLLLEIVCVRVERLNDCSQEDAAAEGLMTWTGQDCDGDPRLDGRLYEYQAWGWQRPVDAFDGFISPVAAYADLWDHINGDGAWKSNPWVWVVEFKVITPDGAERVHTGPLSAARAAPQDGISAPPPHSQGEA